jgi:hypothetical protein
MHLRGVLSGTSGDAFQCEEITFVPEDFQRASSCRTAGEWATASDAPHTLKKDARAAYGVIGSICHRAASATWQLVVNTGTTTTIVTFLMVFLVQAQTGIGSPCK